MLRGVVSGTYWSVVCRWGRSWDASWASGLGIRWIQVSSVKIGERGWGTGFVGKVIKVDIVEKKVFLFLKAVDSPLTLSCSLYSKSTVWYGSSISGKHLFLKLNVLSRTVILGKIRLWLEPKTKAIPVFSKSFWLCFLGTVMEWGLWFIWWSKEKVAVLSIFSSELTQIFELWLRPALQKIYKHEEGLQVVVLRWPMPRHNGCSTRKVL